jgi:DMSO/TMAO reductase YedYZ molybdopterin-dependent catalytic subunit
MQSAVQPRARVPVEEPVESPLNPHVTRRSLLVALGVGGAGVALGSSRLAAILGGGSDTGAIRLRMVRVIRASVPPPAPGDAAFAHIAGLTQEITPTDDFYVVDKDILNPVLSQSSWRLRVGGLVDTPLVLSYTDLRSMQAIERYQTLECISNKVGGHLMSTALWTGIPLADILQMAGVRSGARTVVFRAAGGYSESHALDKAMDPTTLIAIGMNRHELPRVHGFPARLLTVGTYGMKNPKWLTDIEVIDGDYRGYWEVRGWSPDQDPKITTRIDVPTDGATVGHSTVFAGVAFAGDAGISRVQVSTDDGRSWNDARLKTALSPYTWRLWMYEWQPPRAGSYRVLARAFDGSGRVQTSTPAPPFPSGAAGLDGITVDAK